MRHSAVFRNGGKRRDTFDKKCHLFHECSLPHLRLTAQSWVNCGVMEGVGALFPPERIDEEAALGRWIVREMRALGIEPMLQGFTGLLPNSSVDLLRGPKWPDVHVGERSATVLQRERR